MSDASVVNAPVPVRPCTSNVWVRLPHAPSGLSLTVTADSWLADAKASLLSAHGWTVLVYDYQEKKLFNNLIRTEHDVGLFANTHIMVAIDAWEHAYFADYQTKKADYVANVLSGLNWDVINARLQQIGPHAAG